MLGEYAAVGTYCAVLYSTSWSSSNRTPRRLSYRRDRQMEGMWKSILEALTCIYCREYLRAPVRQCLEGHLVCPTCIKKVRNCPQCKSHFITTRNRGIEQIAEVMLYPCVNSSFGCTEKMDKNNKEKHEKDCRLRNVSCLWSKCTWTGSRLYLEEHLNVTHAKYFIKSSDQVLIEYIIKYVIVWNLMTIAGCCIMLHLRKKPLFSK